MCAIDCAIDTGGNTTDSDLCSIQTTQENSHSIQPPKVQRYSFSMPLQHDPFSLGVCVCVCVCRCAYSITAHGCSLQLVYSMRKLSEINCTHYLT